VRSQKPLSSYIVWHTQRTGSSLLCTALEATKVAGHPEEWPEDLLQSESADAEELRSELWQRQTTANGVLGVKLSYFEPRIQRFFAVFGGSASDDRLDVQEIWESVFPNCRHVVMTRRNKFRLAVSWWKSIKGGPGHVSQDGRRLPWQKSLPSAPSNLADSYDFRAIRSLVFESVAREAGIQEFLHSLAATPMGVTYEDFVADYAGTVRAVLLHLGLSDDVPEIPAPLLAKTSDDINEDWLRRFLGDLKDRS
jgi:trehalose 2-sulfotransferase